MDVGNIIKDNWFHKILSDYENDLLLKEDSLKCALYYHLRAKIEQEPNHDTHQYRIFPEYHWQGKKIDMAVVTIRAGQELLKKRVTTILAAVELKYKACSSSYPEERFITETTKDINKLIMLGKKEQSCQLFPIFIWEKPQDISRVRKALQNAANKEVSVFLGYRDAQGKLVQDIL